MVTVGGDAYRLPGMFIVIEVTVPPVGVVERVVVARGAIEGVPA
jgi:hypothetical protein